VTRGARRIVCSAPARANLIGNPSDQYGGNTLAVSLAPRAWVALEEGPGDAAPPPLAAAVLAQLNEREPDFRVSLASEIPRQSGIAGSTALIVALLDAIHAWRGRNVEPHALAELARRVERDGLGVQCGFVDHYLCSFGGLRHVDLRAKGPDGEGAAPAVVQDLGPLVSSLPFIVAYTGVRHSSDAVHRPLRERWLAGEAAVVAGYARIAEIGELGRDALRRADWPAFGRLMNENHAIQRGLGGSGKANEALIEAARGAGALGAKLAGAGGGGSIVALSPEPDAVEASLRKAGARLLLRPVLAPGVQREPEDAILPPDGSTARVSPDGGIP
jgi:galactokinase/mevalonate kinase-like predicted kinase